MILDILLGLLFLIICLIFLVICVKINLELSFLNKKIKIKVKILGFKIDVLKKINMAKVKKTEKKTEKEIDTKIEKEAETKVSNDIELDKIEKKTDKEKIEIEDYLKSLELGLEILDEFTKSLTFDEISADIIYGNKDVSKTAINIGEMWAVYGNLTAFLYSNFKIKHYDVNIFPNWNTEKMVIDVNVILKINTRVIRIIRHTKFKNILEIRKRVM